MANDWQYRMTDEDWKNLAPGGNIRQIATAIQSGLNTYQQAEEEKMKRAPKPLARFNPNTNQLETIGELPQNAQLLPQAPIEQKSKIMIPQYNDKNQIIGYQEQDVAGKGSDVKLAPSMGARASMNMPLSDDEAKDIANQIISGILSPSDISKFSKGMGSIGARNWAMINKILQKEYPNFNLSDYEQAWNYSNSRPIRTYLANIETAEGELKIFNNLNDEFERTGVQGLNKLLQKGEIQFGGVTANNFETAKQAFIDSLSTVLGAAGVSPTDKRLEQAQKTVSGAQTAEQLRSAIKLISDLINIRKHSVNAQGLPGFWDNYYGAEGSTNKGAPAIAKTMGAKPAPAKTNDPLGIR